MAAATVIAALLVSGQVAARNLWVLYDHRVRFDSGPELNDVQFRAALERMKRENDCPDVHVIPDKTIPLAKVVALMREFEQLSGCARIGAAGEAYLPDR